MEAALCDVGLQVVFVLDCFWIEDVYPKPRVLKEIPTQKNMLNWTILGFGLQIDQHHIYVFEHFIYYLLQNNLTWVHLFWQRRQWTLRQLLFHVHRPKNCMVTIIEFLAFQRLRLFTMYIS